MKRQPLTPSHLETEISRSSCQQHPLKVKVSQLQDLARRPNITSGLGLLVIISASTMMTVRNGNSCVFRTSAHVLSMYIHTNTRLLERFVAFEMIPEPEYVIGDHLVCIFLEYAVTRHLQCVIALSYLTAMLYCISCGVEICQCLSVRFRWQSWPTKGIGLKSHCNLNGGEIVSITCLDDTQNGSETR